MELEFYEF